MLVVTPWHQVLLTTHERVKEEPLKYPTLDSGFTNENDDSV